MVIISGSNPLMTHPDINTNIKAFKKLGFIAVFSYHLDNPSARYADIILPQMHKAFEGRDSCFGTGGGTPDSFVSMPTNLNATISSTNRNALIRPVKSSRRDGFGSRLPGASALQSSSVRSLLMS